MKHFLNNIEVTPRNRTDIGMQSDFTSNPDVLELTTDSIILTREAFKQVMSHIDFGSVFEGMPYRIELNNQVQIEYYVDFVQGFTIKQHEVEVKLIRRKGFDDFREKADGTSFELMISKGQSFQYVNIPYLIVPPNLAETILPLIVCSYIMAKEVIEAGKQVADAIIEAIQAATPSVGLGVVMDTGDIIALALKIIGRIIIFALLLTALIKMAAQIFELIFPKKRYFKGCTFLELLRGGCQYLGYSFQSTIFDAEPYWTFLPVPLAKARKSIFDFKPDQWSWAFTKGIPTASDSTPTLGSFIQACESMFNAKVKVINNVVHLERRDHWADLVSTNFEVALNLQSDRDSAYTYNVEDCWKRYYIKYTLDTQEQHTLDGTLYDVHDAEYSTEPLNVINADLVSIKGLQQVDIPFALGARKDKLNWAELYVKAVFKSIDVVTGIFGGGTNYESQIGERKDCLKISQQYFTVSKALYGSNGMQLSTYFSYVDAGQLWLKYHHINAITENGYVIKENARSRISAQEFTDLQNNNYAIINGELSEILQIKFIDEKAFCELTYRTKSNFAIGRVLITKIN